LEYTDIPDALNPNGSFAFDPKNQKHFFSHTRDTAGMNYVSKWEWVPNVRAVAQTVWGVNGKISYSGGGRGFGVVSDGKDYLFAGDAIWGENTKSTLIYLNAADGSEIKRLDLSPWWVDLDDGKAGGQNCGGPMNIIFRNNVLGLNSHSTCMNQLINPYYTDEKNAVLWTNTNGDYTGDHNYDSAATNKWVCNDYNTGVFKYNISMDDNLFMAFPSFTSVNPPVINSFGLYAPDGTGLGYHTLLGETQFFKLAVEFIDYGSAYDGLYTTSNVGRDTQGVDQTVWYVGQDSFRGTISNRVGVVEATPSVYSVARNTPNPFNPSTTITFTLAKAGKTTVDIYNTAGQKIDSIPKGTLSKGTHSVTWNAGRFSAGVYFYTVKSGNFSGTGKMTLLK
jgi:hypothetical protein